MTIGHARILAWPIFYGIVAISINSFIVRGFLMRYGTYDGAQEYAEGPVRLPNGGIFKNVIHTVIDGFCVDWTVRNFHNRSLRAVHKAATTRERQRESRRTGRISIPEGTWARLKSMALEELDKEIAKRSKPEKAPFREAVQRPLFG
jgi:hypothetical protein